MSVSPRPKCVNFRRFTWVGNRIASEDMARLYSLKQQTRTPITVLVAQAVKHYLTSREVQNA